MVDSTQAARREAEFLFYTATDGAVKVSVLFKNETVWLTQKALAELFGVGVPAVNKHLSNIFGSGELDRAATVSKMELVQAEGSRPVAREVEFINLDAIIAVGYRVNSYQATRFRIWATTTLREFIVKGFALDDERMKQGATLFGRDYFDELLERIREIRASERRFYQKITDIYALSVDYDPSAPITRTFFANVQNKLHWAITGQTAAELIRASADAARPHMGLSTWKRAPRGKILKSDVTVAKNYLGEEHIKELNRVVSAYLDLAENRAERGILMKMADWVKFLDGFLELSSYPILADKGTVSALEARLKRSTRPFACARTPSSSRTSTEWSMRRDGLLGATSPRDSVLPRGPRDRDFRDGRAARAATCEMTKAMTAKVDTVEPVPDHERLRAWKGAVSLGPLIAAGGCSAPGRAAARGRPAEWRVDGSQA